MSTLHEVASWAAANGASRDAIYELKKVPARLGMHDDDLGLIPACLRHFEAVVAPSGYAVVSRSGDLDAARRRGNARVRSLLQQFLASAAPSSTQAAGSARGLWDPLIDYVRGLEGFPDEGAPWTKGASRSLTLFRARAACGPAALGQAEVDRINRDLDATKRKSLRKAIARVNKLIAVVDQHPAIAGMLPAAPLGQPAAADRARRITWASLPPAFVDSVHALLARTTETPEDQAREARKRIAAGEDRATVLAEFEAQRTRELGNRNAALAGYRDAITWVLRGQLDRGLDPATLDDVRAIISVRAIEDALDDHVARSKASLKLKDADKSQTGHNRITALHTLALYGLRDRELAEDIRLLLAVEINAYGRTGDVAAWRLGIDLVREPWGAWRLAWSQGKTSGDQDVGELWPEVSEVLDELVLAGRPRRYATLRYTELAGRNWLTHAEEAAASRNPSQLVREAIGVPLHDLRTLVADMLRRIDPARARDLADPRPREHRRRRSLQRRMCGRPGRARMAGHAASDRQWRPSAVAATGPAPGESVRGDGDQEGARPPRGLRYSHISFAVGSLA